MSPSLDHLTDAVVERLMRRYPKVRRSPRAYQKKLKDTSRAVPLVSMPTGPLPDEPWYDTHEEEAEVPLLGEAIRLYHKEHSHRTRMTRYQVERSIYSFMDHAKLHENEPIWCITREACKRWRAALVDPATSTKLGKRIPGAVTLEKRLKMVNHFMAWCVEHDWLPTNPMQGLSLPKRLVKDAKVKKGPFTDEEIAKIIPALLSLPVQDLPRTEFKWGCLGLLFSGARCMEIFQLRQQDIRQVDGIWTFELKTVSEDHRLKNDPSERLVPIHSQLLALGFLDWVKLQPGERVFPTMFRKRAPLVSMWFTRMLKALAIKRPEVSLHSLRHTLAIKLAQARTFPAIQQRLLGHTVGKDVESRVYLAGLTFSVKDLSEALERVRFP